MPIGIATVSALSLGPEQVAVELWYSWRSAYKDTLSIKRERYRNELASLARRVSVLELIRVSGPRYHKSHEVDALIKQTTIGFILQKVMPTVTQQRVRARPARESSLFTLQILIECNRY